MDFRIHRHHRHIQSYTTSFFLYLTSLCFSFLTYQMVIVLHWVVWIKWNDFGRVQNTVLRKRKCDDIFFLFAFRLPFQHAHAKDSSWDSRWREPLPNPQQGFHSGSNTCRGLHSKPGSSICVASANGKHVLSKNDEEFQGGSSSALNWARGSWARSLRTCTDWRPWRQCWREPGGLG